MGQATSNGKSTRLGDSQAGHWLQTRIRFLSVFLFFVAVCVCVLFPRKRRGEEGKRTRWEAARKFFLFFFLYYLFTRLFMIPPSGGFRHHLDAAAAVVIPRKGDSGSVLKSFSGFMSGLTWLYQALPLFLSLFGF